MKYVEGTMVELTTNLPKGNGEKIARGTVGTIIDVLFSGSSYMIKFPQHPREIVAHDMIKKIENFSL